VNVSKNIYKITNFTAIISAGLVALILLFDNVTSNYSLYFRILNLIIFSLFAGFGLWLFEVQRRIFKLYKIPENQDSLNKLSVLFIPFNMLVSIFLLALACGLIDRLYSGISLLG